MLYMLKYQVSKEESHRKHIKIGNIEGALARHARGHWFESSVAQI